MKRILAVAVLLVVCASRSIFAQCSSADKAALEAFDKAWGDASVRGDRTALDNMYAPNFVNLAPAGMTDRATAIANTLTAAEEQRKNPQPVTVPDHYMISCTATTATITHRNTIPPAAGSNEPVAYSRSIHFLEKRGNRWQVVSSAGNSLGDGAVLAYMEHDWNDAIKKRDVAWYEKNLINSATSISSRTGALETKAQMIEGTRTDKTTYESLDLSEMNVRVDGNMAVVTGVNRERGRDAEGRPMDRRIRFTDTFVKRDGKWMVVASQGTEVR